MPSTLLAFYEIIKIGPYPAGMEYDTPLRGVRVYLNGMGLVMGRSKLKETNTADGSRVTNGCKQDRLATFDLNPGLMVMIASNVSLRLGMGIPIWTQYDPGVTRTDKREVIADFGIHGNF